MKIKQKIFQSYCYSDKYKNCTTLKHTPMKYLWQWIQWQPAVE